MWPTRVLLVLGGVLLYLAPFVQTQWAVQGYPWDPAPKCVPGIVYRLFVSEALVYRDWTQSPYPNNREHYYLVILHDDGTQSTQEVSQLLAEEVHPYARWNCGPSSNRGPFS